MFDDAIGNGVKIDQKRYVSKNVCQKMIKTHDSLDALVYLLEISRKAFTEPLSIFTTKDEEEGFLHACLKSATELDSFLRYINTMRHGPAEPCFSLLNSWSFSCICNKDVSIKNALLLYDHLISKVSIVYIREHAATSSVLSPPFTVLCNRDPRDCYELFNRLRDFDSQKSHLDGSDHFDDIYRYVLKISVNQLSSPHTAITICNAVKFQYEIPMSALEIDWISEYKLDYVLFCDQVRFHAGEKAVLQPWVELMQYAVPAKSFLHRFIRNFLAKSMLLPHIIMKWNRVWPEFIDAAMVFLGDLSHIMWEFTNHASFRKGQHDIFMNNVLPKSSQRPNMLTKSFCDYVQKTTNDICAGRPFVTSTPRSVWDVSDQWKNAFVWDDRNVLGIEIITSKKPHETPVLLNAIMLFMDRNRTVDIDKRIKISTMFSTHNVKGGVEIQHIIKRGQMDRVLLFILCNAKGTSVLADPIAQRIAFHLYDETK